MVILFICGWWHLFKVSFFNFRFWRSLFSLFDIIFDLRRPLSPHRPKPHWLVCPIVNPVLNFFKFIFKTFQLLHSTRPSKGRYGLIDRQVDLQHRLRQRGQGLWQLWNLFPLGTRFQAGSNPRIGQILFRKNRFLFFQTTYKVNKKHIHVFTVTKCECVYLS